MDYSIIQQDLEEAPNGEVYFIFMKGDDDKCKIGKSDNPKKRTAQLQTGNPYELYIYKTLKGYAGLEKMLHTYFKEYKIRKTEWFNITFTDVDDIVQQYNELQAENDQILEDTEIDNLLEELVEEIEETETTKITKKKVFKTMKEKHVCQKCGKEFTQERYLQNHLNKKVPCDKKHKCVKCNKEFPSNSALSAHLNKITSCVPKETLMTDFTENKYICQYCNKTYATTSSLKRHQIEVCSKNISKIDYLISLVMELKEENALQNPRFDFK